MNSVNNMYLAAAIISYGGKLEKIDRTDKSRQKFVFSSETVTIRCVGKDNEIIQKTACLEEVLTMYSSKQLWFPPTYPDCIRDIKSAIHQA